MTENLINRISFYLASGGLFNPELADHIAVRTLLFECREALAQPEQEPVALVYDPITGSITPLQHTWVGLTLDEQSEAYEKSGGNLSRFAKGIEAKLKEKNT